MRHIIRSICLMLIMVLCIGSFPFTVSAAGTDKAVMTADEFVDYLYAAYGRKTFYGSPWPYNVGYYNSGSGTISWDCNNLGVSIIASGGAIVNNYTSGTDVQNKLYINSQTKDPSGSGILNGDYSPYGLKSRGYDVSSDWTNIEKGEWLYMHASTGDHIGYYVGDGKVIQITYNHPITCNNLKSNGWDDWNSVAPWQCHFKVPWIEYEEKFPKMSPACGTIKTKEKAWINSLPYSREGRNDVDNVAVVEKGTELVVCGVYENEYGNYWYKVTKNNTTGKEYKTDAFLYSGNTDPNSFKPMAEKSALTNQNPPTVVNQHDVFGVNGVITNKYTKLSLIGAKVTSMSGEFQTGKSQNVDTYSASLSGAVNNGTEFNILAPGTYKFIIYEEQYGYYATSPKEIVKYPAVAYEVMNVAFTVKDKAATTYTLTLDNNGHGNGINMFTVAAGTVITLPTLENTDGYAFWGWTDTKDSLTRKYHIGDSYTVNGNATLYAVWQRESTIRLYKKDGTLEKEYYYISPFDFRFSSFDIGEEPGYYFYGWTLDPDSEGYDYRPDDIMYVEGEVSVYARYTSHADAISGKPVLIYDINDVDTSNYTVTPTVLSVNRSTSEEKWSDWSEWSTTEVAETSTRKVRTTTLYRYYYYDCPSCDLREPYSGTCDNGHRIDNATQFRPMWSVIPFSESKSTSYDGVKSKTTSLGDGLVWYFNTSDKNKTAIGTKESAGGTIIMKGYSYSDLIENTSSETVEYPAYILTPSAVYTVTYNANGGTGAPSAQSYTVSSSVNVTLSPVTPTRSGYTFAGWSTSSASTTAEYSSGASYTLDGNVTLYAVWKCSHTNTETRNAKNAGCTTEGYTGDQYCKTCGAKLSSGKTIPAKGHSWNSGVVTKAATTSATGVKTYTCTVCGKTRTETIPKLSDSFTVGIDTVSAQSGKEFTVKFDYEGVDGLCSFGIWYTFDKDVFEFVGGKCLSPDYGMFEASEIDGLIAAFDTPAVAGEVAEVTFRVKDGVEAGDYNIEYYFTAEDSNKNAHEYIADGKVTVTSYIRGDVNDDSTVNSADALYLLRHTMRASKYPINQNGDMNGDNTVNSADALYLLRYTMRPSKYPLF